MGAMKKDIWSNAKISCRIRHYVILFSYLKFSFYLLKLMVPVL